MMYNEPDTRVSCTKTMPPMHLTRGLVEHPFIFRPRINGKLSGITWVTQTINSNVDSVTHASPSQICQALGVGVERFCWKRAHFSIGYAGCWKGSRPSSSVPRELLRTRLSRHIYFFDLKFHPAITPIMCAALDSRALVSHVLDDCRNAATQFMQGKWQAGDTLRDLPFPVALRVSPTPSNYPRNRNLSCPPMNQYLRRW